MPRATFNPDLIKTFELETCPGAFIKVRRLSLGESAQREQRAMEMAVSGADAKSRRMDIKVQIQDLLAFDFATQIVEHNLEDENGALLNFKNPADVNRLDAAIGEEIKRCVESMATEKVSDDVKN